MGVDDGLADHGNDGGISFLVDSNQSGIVGGQGQMLKVEWAFYAQGFGFVAEKLSRYMFRVPILDFLTRKLVPKVDF